MSTEEKDAIRRRVAANRDLDSSRMDVRKDLIAKKGAQKAVKMTITRMAKSGLLESTKFRRQQALEDKFRRFEWRMHREEVVDVQKRWIVAAVFAGVVTVAFRKFESRKRLHIRSHEALVFLTRMSITLGKLRRKLTGVRIKRSLRVIPTADDCEDGPADAAQPSRQEGVLPETDIRVS